jgi:hypothetical protein
MMAKTRVTLRLTELRCLKESDEGGAEPYLWTTFFAYGAGDHPENQQVQVYTPEYDAFRAEIADGVTAGQTRTIPPFISSGTFDFDLTSIIPPKVIGCVAVVMEENGTPNRAMVAGRIAYAKEIDVQLKALIPEYISPNSPELTKEVLARIGAAVEAKVYEAVKRDQYSVWNLSRSRDEPVGYTYAVFSYPSRDIDGDDDLDEIKFQYFDFPEITKSRVVRRPFSEPTSVVTDRYALSGSVSLGRVVEPTPQRCGAERAALNAKKAKHSALATRLASLQDSLHGATPQQKAGYIALIKETQAEIAAVEAELPALQAALDACMGAVRPGEGDVNDPGPLERGRADS